MQRTFFGLERDRAREQLIRSIILLGLIFVGLVLTFVVATFAGPALPLTSRPTVMPTVSLLHTPADQGQEISVQQTSTPLAADVEPGAGCQNPNANISFPPQGFSVSEIVEVLGTANIPGFAFYKIEIRDQSPDAVWRAIGAGTDPVCPSGCPNEELLSRWDTSLLTPGDYSLRLVVTDTAGNAPLPCVINIRVLPSE
jgi:hypothetical protein